MTFRNFFFLLCIFFVVGLKAQEEAPAIHVPFLEDQLYITTTYSIIYDQAYASNTSGFSYGLSAGFLKDIPFSAKGTFAAAVGLGYSLDALHHSFQLSVPNTTVVFEAIDTATSNPLRIHAIEFPFELRWRDATPTKYAFWRVYVGMKATYNMHHTFEMDTASYTHTKRLQKWQYGLTLSAGYGAMNLYTYYGLSPLLKESALGTSKLSAKVLKVGLVFYIL